MQSLGIVGAILIIAATFLGAYGVIGAVYATVKKELRQLRQWRSIKRETQSVTSSNKSGNLFQPEQKVKSVVQLQIHFDQLQSKNNIRDLLLRMKILECSYKKASIIVQSEGRYVFQIFNMSEDGGFGESDEALSSMGLICVANLERTPTPTNAFNLMLRCAADLSRELKAAMFDDKKQELTDQWIADMRREVQQFELTR